MPSCAAAAAAIAHRANAARSLHNLSPEGLSADGSGDALSTAAVFAGNGTSSPPEHKIHRRPAMKKALSKLLEQALRPVAGERAERLRHAGLEQARDARNGHYATSAAMQLAGELKRPLSTLPKTSPPGFRSIR